MVGEGRTGTDCLAQDSGREARQELQSRRRGRDHHMGRLRGVNWLVEWMWGLDRAPGIKGFKWESEV